MEQLDVLIIGAGLLGCFAARALSAYDLRVAVLEAREDVCTGVSRANSGIIYAGYDTKPGTLKSRLTVRAAGSMAQLCRELDVPFSPCGSLMVACGPRAEAVLRKKYSDGLSNGVPGLRLLSGAETLAMEPRLTRQVTAGLYAPGAGTLDPWALGIAAFENARANGVEFRFCEALTSLSREQNAFLAETETGSYRARAVINCAGLSADRVRELCEPPLIRLFPSAGDYLVLDAGSGAYVEHVVFHEPEHRGKGLTLIPTVDGNLLVGPTEHDAGAPGATLRSGLDALKALCREIVPELNLNLTIRSFAALRPNPYYVRFEHGDWVPEARAISSFSILEERGLYSLIGIKTPGLTCACELGNHVAGLLLRYLGGAAPRQDFDPCRKRIPVPRCMSPSGRASFVAAHPDFGHILCRCRDVSEGEVREAIRRGASTIDGVKRRTGAGMGRCQGGYCQQKILALLSEATGNAPECIPLDAPGSEVLLGPL